MKRTFALLLLINMLLFILPVAADEPERQLILTVNYHRTAGDYEGWGLSIMPSGGVAKTESFKKNYSFGRTGSYRVAVPEGSDRILVTVLKDTEQDGSVKNVLIDGTAKSVEIWLVEGDDMVYFSEEMALKNRITSAYFTSLSEIEFTTSAPVGRNAKAVVTDGNYKVQFDMQMTDSNSGKIKLYGDIQPSDTYTLKLQGFSDKIISKTKLYDTEKFKSEYENELPLGAVYTSAETTFSVWSPFASQVSLLFYADGIDGEISKTIPMANIGKGVWQAAVSGDYDGQYYNFSVTIDGSTSVVIDPYARSAGLNGHRGMVIDLSSTDPSGWQNDKHITAKSPVDAVVYEVHLRDFVGGESESQYLDFAANRHLKELGITHVQLMPIFDFGSVDESDRSQYNWGYDPVNYNLPEGGYSSDPADGAVRIRELKQMIKSLHEQNIGVIMDVVYNHTYSTASSFNGIAPEYFYRTTDGGQYSNGSGCGNETATERFMAKRFFIESMVYWATEYHIDGFRVDLMGLHDIEFVNELRLALDEIDPKILLYGEGWWGGESTINWKNAALKDNAQKLPDTVGFFSDDMRDSVRGNVFDHTEKGFASGNVDKTRLFKSAITASTNHPEASASKWAGSPTQVVNYVSCHDNLTLWDKLCASNDYTDDVELLLRLNKLSAVSVFTSQGMPFMLSGEEFGRTKHLNDNSYNAGDETNMIDWSLKENNEDLYKYYCGLIQLRKAHPAFRLTTAEQVESALTFFDLPLDEGILGYTLDGSANGDEWKDIVVLFNVSDSEKTFTLPERNWVVVVNEKSAGIAPLASFEGSEIVLPPKSAYVLTDRTYFKYTEDIFSESENQIISDENEITTSTDFSQNRSILLTVGTISCIGLAIGGGYILMLHLRSRHKY